MQVTLAALSKKAVSCALKGKWEEAIIINEKILSKDSNNIDAKIRLGRAYIQTQKFNKAKTIFEDVLKKDPLNNIAKKNLQTAKNKKTDKNSKDHTNAKALLKEPGTSVEIHLKIESKSIEAGDFDPGEQLDIDILKTKVKVIKINGRRTVINTIDNKDLVKKINRAENIGATVGANFLKGEKKDIFIIIKSSKPVFKTEKQDIRPYVKKEIIQEEESELDMSTTEESLS